jgi:hypothetical protein
MAIVLVWVAMVHPVRSSEITTFNEGFGTEKHTRYSVDTWEGRAFTISRLTKTAESNCLTATNKMC